MSSKFSELRQEIAELRDVSSFILETIRQKAIGERADILAKDAWVKLNHAKAFLGKANPEPSPYPKHHKNIEDLKQHPESDVSNQQVLFDIEKTDDLISLCDYMRNHIEKLSSKLTMEIEYSHYSSLVKDNLEAARIDYGFIFNEIRNAYA